MQCSHICGDLRTLRNLIAQKLLCAPPAPSPETAPAKGGWSCLHTDLPLASTSSLPSGRQIEELPSSV